MYVSTHAWDTIAMSGRAGHCKGDDSIASCGLSEAVLSYPREETFLSGGEVSSASRPRNSGGPLATTSTAMPSSSQ